MGEPGDLGEIIQIGESSTDKRLLCAILERLPLLIVAFDESFAVALWNREAVRVTGRSAAEMIGNSRYLELLYPDEDYREEIVAASAADFDGMERRELTLTTREGVERDIAWTSMIRELPIPGFSDWWVGVDVTDVRRTERELRKSQDTLRKAHEVAQLGAWSYDVESRRIDLTPEAARLLGVGDDVSGNLDDLRPLFQPDGWEAVLAAHEGAAAQRPVPSLELPIVRPDGAQRWVRTEADFADEDDRGRPRTRLVGIIHDITEQRQLEQRVRQSERMAALSRLASGVAHDLNNVLTVVGGCAELLGEIVPDSEAARRELTAIGESFERGRALVQELLAFSRQQVLRPTVFELSELVSRMTPLLGRAVAPDFTVTTLLGDGVGSVHCDRSQLEQVILSLVVNAQATTRPGDRLTVATRAESLAAETAAVGGVLSPGDYAVVEIAGGAALEEDELVRRFEPFFGASAAPAGRMSLASAFGVVAQSGGRIRVDAAPTSGTAVMVYLPVHRGADATAEAPIATPGQSGGEHILLVEDDELVRDVVARTLGGAGYDLAIASNGEEALRLCRDRDTPFDLALADVVMPLMSGPELAARLREQRPGMRIMLMSGYDSAQIREDAYTAFLPKPFAPSSLLVAVRELLAR